MRTACQSAHPFGMHQGAPKSAQAHETFAQRGGVARPQFRYALVAEYSANPYWINQ